MSRLFQIIGRCLIVLTLTFITLFIIYDFYLITQKLFEKNDHPFFLGYSLEATSCGYMDKVINVGDLILVKKQDEYNLRDIVEFSTTTGIYLARITNESEFYYTLQTEMIDGNNQTFVKLKTDIDGKVFVLVPKIGVVINYLQTIQGLSALTIVFFLIGILPILIKQKRESEEGEVQSNNNQFQNNQKEEFDYEKAMEEDTAEEEFDYEKAMRDDEEEKK